MFKTIIKSPNKHKTCKASWRLVRNVWIYDLQINGFANNLSKKRQEKQWDFCRVGVEFLNSYDQCS